MYIVENEDCEPKAWRIHDLSIAHESYLFIERKG